MRIFNPLRFFKNPWIYKSSFSVWLDAIYDSLVGNFRAFGFLDYVFVLPGLVKLFCDPQSESRSQLFLCGFSNFLSIFKHVTAFFLTLASLPLTCIFYIGAGKKATQLKNTILEIEVLPVSEEKLNNLDYKKDGSRRINKKKLVDMFGDGGSENRIKFKNHPDLAPFLKDNMESHIILPIRLEDEKGTVLKDKIFGLFPCLSLSLSMKNYNGMLDIDDGISRRKRPLLVPSTFPLLLLIPSKENTQEMIAMERFDAFFFSAARDEDAALKDKMGQYSQQDNPFNPERQRRNIQFSLEQASRAAVAGTGLDEIKTSLDPLITSITQFAGLGSLRHDDVRFLDELRGNSTLFSPREPYITSRPSEFKEAIKSHREILGPQN